MDNIDIFSTKLSHYYRLPTEIVENCENSPLFTSLIAISTGYRTGTNKLIGYFVKGLYEKDYFIKYCVSGTGWFEVENKRFIISAGDLILCERNTPHQYGTSTEDPWSAYWVLGAIIWRLFSLSFQNTTIILFILVQIQQLFVISRISFTKNLTAMHSLTYFMLHKPLDSY